MGQAIGDFSATRSRRRALLGSMTVLATAPAAASETMIDADAAVESAIDEYLTLAKAFDAVCLQTNSSRKPNQTQGDINRHYRELELAFDKAYFTPAVGLRGVMAKARAWKSIADENPGVCWTWTAAAELANSILEDLARLNAASGPSGNQSVAGRPTRPVQSGEAV